MRRRGRQAAMWRLVLSLSKQARTSERQRVKRISFVVRRVERVKFCTSSNFKKRQKYIIQ